jgi:hypothetical protein
MPKIFTKNVCNWPQDFKLLDLEALVPLLVYKKKKFGKVNEI